MTREWPTKSLSDLAAPEDGAIAIGPFGSAMKADTYSASGVPIIRGTNISDTRAWKGDWVFVPEQFADSISRCTVTADELVFPHRGSIGEVAIVPPDRERYVLSSSLMKIRINQEIADPLFVYYYFRSAAGKAEILRYASQVGTPGIGQPLSSLRQFKLPCPPRDSQKAIAKTLAALDDKIELNRQMNETLGAMASAVFRDWFVDFGPTRAKMEGQAPYLVPDLWSQFPGSLDDAAGVPAGWQIVTLQKLTSKIGSGATPRGGSKVYVEHGISLIRSQNVYDGLFDWGGLARITDDAADRLGGVSVMKKDVLINITGDSILRTCVVDPRVLPARVNQHVSIVRPVSGVPPHFIHQYLLLERTKNLLLGMDSGGSRSAVTKGHLESLPILHPSTEALAAFAKLTDPLFERIENNAREAHNLTELRDFLLPRLMSGEINVRQDEKLASNVA